jgi:hypothetical protein
MQVLYREKIFAGFSCHILGSSIGGGGNTDISAWGSLGAGVCKISVFIERRMFVFCFFLPSFLSFSPVTLA